MRLFFLPLGITTSRSCSPLQLQRPISQDEKSSRDCTTKYELQCILLTQRSAPSPQVPVFEVKPRRRSMFTISACVATSKNSFILLTARRDTVLVLRECRCRRVVGMQCCLCVGLSPMSEVDTHVIFPPKNYPRTIHHDINATLRGKVWLDLSVVPPLQI